MTDGNKFLSRRFQAASRCFILIARELFAVAVPPHFGVILTDDQGWSPTWVLMDPLVPESKSDFFKTPNIKKIASAGSLVPYGVRISMSGATCWKCTTEVSPPNASRADLGIAHDYERQASIVTG